MKHSAIKVFVFILMCVAQNVRAQENVSIEVYALDDSIRTSPKPTLLLLSTRWCMYCQMQKAQLKKNKEFQDAKDWFYYTELDAETKDSIVFNRKVYRYKSIGTSSGIHELAIELGNQKGGIAYPAWVLIDKNYRVIYRHNGLLSPDEMKVVIDFIKKM